MKRSIAILGNQDAQTFINEFWQKQPCLIRAAIPDFIDPLSPEELAGLACEADVQSRIVLEKDGKTPWEVQHGPFTEKDFLKLPECNWTLLVQDMNQHDIELARLLDHFDFIPAWRLDDVMVSYAPTGGSVGPHIDQYDVFLLQGMGQRRWQIHSHPGDKLLEDTELRILAEFEAEQEWILQSGDMLYLPPGVAHYGVALNDCMTYSIGFRSPLIHDLLCEWSDALLLSDSQQLRFSDNRLPLQRHPAELTQERIDSLYNSLQQAMHAPDTFRSFIASALSQCATDTQPESLFHGDVESLIALHKQYQSVQRTEYARFLFIENHDGPELYINGEAHSVSATAAGMIRHLCNQRSYTTQELTHYLKDDVCQTVLLDWFHQGYLYFPEHD